MKTNRFRSTIKWLDYFKDIINVHCPNCNKKAQLLRKFDDQIIYRDSYEFQCNNCYVEIKEIEKFIYNVNRNCPFCPEVIHYKSTPTVKIKKEVEVICKGCKEKIRYIPKVESVYDWMQKGENVEFLYWFIEEFRGNIFWALNDKHLEYLENFVFAKLRQRTIEPYGMMLIDKLPQFIKDKKNRGELLKLISKMKEK
ncbi:hypothetical protein ABW636_09765 [Aquimarina sp. 2201CG1-2-11]|uniref:hypothetical protein n=1 Tax=Aquimarina discodermiae TaxID=3231043 RepID=UPI003462829B